MPANVDPGSGDLLWCRLTKSAANYTETYVCDGVLSVVERIRPMLVNGRSPLTGLLVLVFAGRWLSGLFEDVGDGRLSSRAGVGERGPSVAVGQIRVGTGGEKDLHDLLVPLAAIAEDDRFE